MELTVSDSAWASIKEISEYISVNFNERLARKTVDTIFREVSILKHSPRLGMLVFSHTSYGELRQLTIRRNNVYYRIIDNRVEVVVVWDYRRSQDELLDRILDYFNALE